MTDCPAIFALLLLGGGLGTALAEPVPDFTLDDENPFSNREGGFVSPADYRLQISAWYFGNAG